MKKKIFIYLVQGKKENVQKFSFLQTEISDLITLTFDYDFNNDINWLKNLYLPKSTWAEGRNLQLEYASNLNIDYLYYIFLDDDTKLIKGTFNQFEELLIKYEPAVGLPLCDIVKNNLFFLSSKKVQHAIIMDQIFQAYHKIVVKEKIALPFVTKFDSLSWWYSCEINGYLIISNYLGSVIQFNDIEIINSNHNWDTKSYVAVKENSNYIGGITEKGLQLVKEYLQTINLQHHLLLINTLFPPKRANKKIPIPYFNDTFYLFSCLIIKLDFKNISRKLFFLFRYLPYSLFYKLFYPKNIINPYRFRSIKYFQNEK